MFDNSLIYVIEGARNQSDDRRISYLNIGEEKRNSLVSLFDRTRREQITGFEDSLNTIHPYSPGYSIHPEDQECMCIYNFAVPEDIIFAVDNISALEHFRLEAGTIPNIRAFFTCDQDDKIKNFAFQRFRSHQYLSPAGFHLFYSKKTLREHNVTGWSKGGGKAGITIAPVVDCYIDGEGLKFKNSFFANQIFDLADYSKEANDENVRSFLRNEKLHLDDLQQIIDDLGIRERKKIGSILDKGTLTEHSVEYIAEVAKQIDYKIDISGDKIIIPTDRRKRRELWAFLDEDIYRGSFSEEVYLSNSKRPRSKT